MHLQHYFNVYFHWLKNPYLSLMNTDPRNSFFQKCSHHLRIECETFQSEKLPVSVMIQLIALFYITQFYSAHLALSRARVIY